MSGTPTRVNCCWSQNRRTCKGSASVACQAREAELAVDLVEDEHGTNLQQSANPALGDLLFRICFDSGTTNSVRVRGQGLGQSQRQG